MSYFIQLFEAASLCIPKTSFRRFQPNVTMRYVPIAWLARSQFHPLESPCFQRRSRRIAFSVGAHDVLVNWKKEQADKSQFLFPSPVKPGQPITTVKKAWKTTLKNAGVAHFPIYNLRHVFCTRLSWVAPDTVVQRAMRHSSPETKRHYQLGMVEQVRQNLEKANQRVYGKGKVLRFHDVPSPAEVQQEAVVCK